MSNVLHAEPYVRRARRQAAAVVSDAPDVIVSEPRVDELSVTEKVNLARPYIAALLLLVAAIVAYGLARRLYARYRRENVPSVTRAPMDRRSLRRAALENATAALAAANSAR